MQIDLNKLLSDLEQLRHRPGFDPEDKSLMMQYEIEVANYEALLALKHNPVFNGLMKMFGEEVQKIDQILILSAKDMLGNPEKQREAIYLSAKKDVYVEFIEQLKKDPEQLIVHIRERVDHFIK